jgi:DNA-binding NtrC family response regulator
MTDSPHILIVDDDKQVVRYMREALAENGYDVTATTSGQQALDIIQGRRPDLLILDLNMPGPDGFDVLKLQRFRSPYLRTIVISGYLQGALLDAAKICGAIATLEKPVAPDALVGKVREVLGR